MAEPTTTPDITTKPKASEIIAERDRTIAELRDQLATLQRSLDDIEQEQQRIAQAAAERAAERNKAIANNDPPKLIGSINVYLQDMPEDIVDRARPLFEGRVPVDRATKFRVEGRLTMPSRFAEGEKPWPLLKRFPAGSSPKVGDTFGADEMPASEIARYAKQGVIVPIA